MALFLAGVWGVLAGFLIGSLAQNALPAVLAFAIVAALAAWLKWPKKR